MILIGVFASKFLSGYVAGSLIGFQKQDNILIGAGSIPKLATTLAVAFTAMELGLIDASLQVSIVLLSIITMLVALVLMGFLVRAQRAVGSVASPKIGYYQSQNC